MARPRYRNAIFIAGARARAPIHPRAHTQYTRLRPPHRNCQLYRGNRSPQSPAISPAATSLLMLPPSSSYILDHRHLHRVSSTNSATVHDRYRYLPRFSICRRILSWEECRTRHLFSASVNAANYRQTENRVSLHRYTRRTFSTPSFFRSSFRFSVDIFPIFPPLPPPLDFGSLRRERRR